MTDNRIEGSPPSPEANSKGEWLIWLLSNVILAFNGILWLVDEDRIMRVIGGLTVVFAAMTIGRILVVRKTGRPPHSALRAVMTGLVALLIAMLCYKLILVLGSLTGAEGRPPG